MTSLACKKLKGLGIVFLTEFKQDPVLYPLYASYIYIQYSETPKREELFSI